MHLTDKEVGFGINGNSKEYNSIGVGLGNAIKLLRSKNLIIYLGDAATEEGVFWESVHYSLVHNCLSVCN